MRYNRLITFSVLLLVFISCKQSDLNTEPQSFNKNWLFFKGEAQGAEHINYDDTQWRTLNLPHDWAIEGPFDIRYNARCGGLPFHGNGWYRKHFQIPKSAQEKHVTLHFDGAMNNAKVYLNGHLVGHRPNGYIGFTVNLSEHLNYGGDNIVAVQLTPEDLSSRWYPGAGIYRNTWIEFNNKIHIPQWGTYITTPKITVEEAKVNLNIEVNNVSKANSLIVVKSEIYNSQDIIVASVSDTINTVAKSMVNVFQKTVVSNPKLWNLDTPNLYVAKTMLYDDKGLIDTYNTTFGIRSIIYDSDSGFKLNNNKTRFQGVCLHHDLGPLGTAVNERATERQLEIMKRMGVNAVRTSHNPPSPEQVKLCDAMGIMMQVEAFDVWKKSKVENDYSKYFEDWHEQDLRDLIRTFRNNPSVVMWSIGNEIQEQADKVNGGRIAKELVSICKDEDPTRPTTAGFNYYRQPIKNGLAEAVDLVGWNYKPRKYKEVLSEYPQWIVYGSETSSTVSSRGVYHLPLEKYRLHPSLQITSYDFIGPPWAYPPDIEFEAIDNNPKHLGEFIWTGFDYLGEPTPYGGRDNSTNGYWNGHWPARSSYFGAVDLAGFPKDRFYLYQSQWTKEPMVHLLPHWNWEGREEERIPVFVYTNVEEVELFLNGKSLGKKVKGKDKTPIPINFIDWEGGRYRGDFLSPYRLKWEVPYEKGTLSVKAYKGNEIVAEAQRITAGNPTKIRLIPDRSIIKANNDDLSFITVEVTDEQGNICPNASNNIHFEVNGEGVVAAVGNGNAASTESFQDSQRKAFQGKCLLVIKSTHNSGKINITASAKGLASESISIRTKH